MTLYGPVVNTILLKNYSCRIDWDKKYAKSNIFCENVNVKLQICIILTYV